MQVTMVICFAGGIGRSPLSKELAYLSLFLSSSSVVLIALMLAFSKGFCSYQLIMLHSGGWRIAMDAHV
jgi:hypothetical protein